VADGEARPCPRCGTTLAPGTRYCPTCGTPVVPPELPVPGSEVEEWTVGQILSAFSSTHLEGPVRITFTDRRVLVHWIGPHTLFVRPRIYAAWKATLAGFPIYRQVRGPWSDGMEPLAIAFDLECIHRLRAAPVHGIGVDRDVCQLVLFADESGVVRPVTGPTPFPLTGPEEGNWAWKVPGSAPVLRDFLLQMPVASRVGTG
jgi:hypothetical protein